MIAKSVFVSFVGPAWMLRHWATSMLVLGLAWLVSCAPDDNKDRGFVAKRQESNADAQAAAASTLSPIGTNQIPVPESPNTAPSALPVNPSADPASAVPGGAVTDPNIAQTKTTPTPEPSPQQRQTCAPGSQPARELLVASQMGLNVRAEPGSGGAVLASLAEGTRVKDWGAPRLVSGDAWICGTARGASGVELTGWMKESLLRPL